MDSVLAIELLETFLKLFQAGPCHSGRGCFLVCRGFRHVDNDAELCIVQPFDHMSKLKNGMESPNSTKVLLYPFQQIYGFVVSSWAERLVPKTAGALTMLSYNGPCTASVFDGVEFGSYLFFIAPQAPSHKRLHDKFNRDSANR
jgi:hypothetical protein